MLEKVDDDECHYMITIPLVYGGREEAFAENESIIERLTKESYPPVKAQVQFVVYDTAEEQIASLFDRISFSGSRLFRMK